MHGGHSPRGCSAPWPWRRRRQRPPPARPVPACGHPTGCASAAATATCGRPAVGWPQGRRRRGHCRQPFPRCHGQRHCRRYAHGRKFPPPLPPLALRAGLRHPVAIWQPCRRRAPAADPPPLRAKLQGRLRRRPTPTAAARTPPTIKSGSLYESSENRPFSGETRTPPLRPLMTSSLHTKDRDPPNLFAARNGTHSSVGSPSTAHLYRRDTAQTLRFQAF